jgi:hypothetical protein
MQNRSFSPITEKFSMGSKGKYGNMEILTVSGRSDNVRT